MLDHLERHTIVPNRLKCWCSTKPISCWSWVPEKWRPSSSRLPQRQNAAVLGTTMPDRCFEPRAQSTSVPRVMNVGGSNSRPSARSLWCYAYVVSAIDQKPARCFTSSQPADPLADFANARDQLN
jgi:hypothetical protein